MMRKTKETQKTNLKSKSQIYMMHNHFAKHQHWDLRLEHKGKLKSWALPKKPPVKPGDKRLAVQVADHAIEYAKFRGTIPKGSYGAGKVKIWDKGTYEAISIKPKKWVIKIKGKKLKGEYALIKFREKSWIFFKTKNK